MLRHFLWFHVWYETFAGERSTRRQLILCLWIWKSWAAITAVLLLLPAFSVATDTGCPHCGDLNVFYSTFLLLWQEAWDQKHREDSRSCKQQQQTTTSAPNSLLGIVFFSPFPPISSTNIFSIHIMLLSHMSCGEKMSGDKRASKVDSG